MAVTLALCVLPGFSVSAVSAAVTELRQADFAMGTYRIRRAGMYRLQEDIAFAPRLDNDYWNVPGDPEYPMGQFYLGFFAALTIEAEGVEIDLNGHSISQDPDFYLAQRFWNAIELADRVFVDNEGVASLNFQTGDKLQWQHPGAIPALRPARNVSIRNGVLGLSSHSGIHGNGATNVLIENVTVRDFEVAGIQCNGCQDVAIVDCIVGPSSTQVPVLGTFSNARFLNLYTRQLIPKGFAMEGLSSLLDDNNTLRFADRPDTVSISRVFKRCEDAEELYRAWLKGTVDVSGLTTESAALLAEARHVFDNPRGLPDGSVVYGILVNHLGVPNDDENHYGAGLESARVEIRRTHVHGLKAAPVEVPALQAADGSFLQGPARDLLRIFDLVDDSFRSLVNAQYRGNFLSDVYFALWKLSNDYYVQRVYASTCGNFGSNATLPYTYWQGECAAGKEQDPSLTGRDVTMLQKKYFGGLSITQDLFDWATVAGSSLHKLFISQPEFQHRRQTKHFIMCDSDTMFHPMHGVVGIKMRWTRNVVMEEVRVDDLVNLGDDWHWVCSQAYELPENQELVKPLHPQVPRAGADVRGLELLQCTEVFINDLSVHGLDSDEGRVIGIEVSGDKNDRTDYGAARAAQFRGTTVTGLRGGHGAKVRLVLFDDNELDLGGISSGAAAVNHNNFRQPKTFILYENAGGVVPSSPNGSPFFLWEDSGVIDRWMEVSQLDTEEKLLGFRRKVLGFLAKQYGLSFSNANASVRERLWVQGTDSFLAPQQNSHHLQHKGVSICTDAGQCTVPSVNSFCSDFFFNVNVGPSGLMLHGEFGGDAGKFAPSGDLIVSGMYVFENFTVPGTADTGNLEIHFFGLCPVTFLPWPGNDLTTFYIDCALESPLLGHGRATAAFELRPLPDGNYVLWSFGTLVWEDSVPNPSNMGVSTEVYKDAAFPTPDVAFSWLADGVYPVPGSTAGQEVFPYLYQHHWIHEAGVRCLQRWTSFTSDAAVRQLRYDFMVFLRDVYGIAAADPDAYANESLSNQIDLGGGNTIAPYAVNHWSNQRLITKKRQGEMLQFPELDARLHEGGFRLFVGRAGVSSARWGYLPYGSLVAQGFYVLEGDPDLGTHEIAFRSSIPVLAHTWSTSVVLQDLTSGTYGSGTAHIVVPAPFQGLDGLPVGIRGTFTFKNASGGYPGLCYDCPLMDPFTGNYPNAAPVTPPQWPQPEHCVPSSSGTGAIAKGPLALSWLGLVSLALGAV